MKFPLEDLNFSPYLLHLVVTPPHQFMILISYILFQIEIRMKTFLLDNKKNTPTSFPHGFFLLQIGNEVGTDFTHLVFYMHIHHISIPKHSFFLFYFFLSPLIVSHSQQFWSPPLRDYQMSNSTLT